MLILFQCNGNLWAFFELFYTHVKKQSICGTNREITDNLYICEILSMCSALIKRPKYIIIGNVMLVLIELTTQDFTYNDEGVSSSDKHDWVNKWEQILKLFILITKLKYVHNLLHATPLVQTMCAATCPLYWLKYETSILVPRFKVIEVMHLCLTNSISLISSYKKIHTCGIQGTE